MINHLRTLLLNESGPAVYEYPGSEYTPPSFVRKKLPAYMVRIFELLYGKDPDITKKNYRAYQLLLSVHSSDLDYLAKKLDPRVTYWPFDKNKLIFPHIVSVIGDTKGLQIVDRCLTETAAGRIYYKWTVRVTGYTINGSGEVTDISTDIKQVYPQYAVPIDKVNSVTRDLSEKIVLPGSSMGLLISTSVPVGTDWIIKAVAEPRLDLGEVLQQIRSSQASVELFAPSLEEPWPELISAWNDVSRPTRQLAALALAIGYRMDKFEEAV